MQLKNFKRIFVFFLLLQIIIWAKAFLFFQWFGFGAVNTLNRQFFPEEILLPNFLFHETMHALILIVAFSFARQLKEIDDAKLLKLVFAAAVLHNIAYWFTRVFETHLGLVVDFFTDIGVLYAFIITSNYLAKKYFFFRNLKIPLLS